MLKKLVRTLFSLLVCLAIVGSISIVGIGYIYWHIKITLPNDNFLNEYQAPELTRIYDRHFQLLQEWAPVNRINIRFTDIPEKVIAAFLVAEDKNFYNHSGIDPLRIILAAFQNLTQGKLTKNLIGASTITQQVAKIF